MFADWQYMFQSLFYWKVLCNLLEHSVSRTCFSSFNPYFSGRYSATQENQHSFLTDSKVSILVLLEGTLQLAKIFPCLANSHLFCLFFWGLFGTSTLDTLIYKDMLYLNLSILHLLMLN